MVQKRIAIIIPAYNEKDNIAPLMEEIQEMTLQDSRGYEVILVDDGSTDGTFKEAKRLTEKYPMLRVLRHRRNLGKTDAILTGFFHSDASILVVMDADLQFDSNDIPLLLDEMEKGFDIVTGWKQGQYSKRFVSTVYNWLSRHLFHLPIHDQNAIKALKSKVLEEIDLRKDWHRYIVALAVNKGFTVSEVKVKLRSRLYGESKYGGKGRVLVGLMDLLSVKLQISLLRKPLLFFGTLGGILVTLGILAGLYGLIQRFVYQQGYRPILYLVLLLVVSGLVLFTVGFVTEAITALSERIARLEKEITGYGAQGSSKEDQV
ncbi:glycosyltransferase family 2 protein [candidate division WOR-3 bacterium]|nr:glycosyltransferase family 2 protein [candidate division WOR-3 bacterium]